MTTPEPQNVCEIVSAEGEDRFRAFLGQSPRGIAMIPEEYGNVSDPALKSDAGDFAKWLGSAHPEIEVDLPAADRLVLRSNDIWLPLVFLASDVALPVYLGLVTNYLYDRMRGMLRNERPRVDLSAEYMDGETGSVKRFNFKGDADALKDAVRAFGLDEFYDPK